MELWALVAAYSQEHNGHALLIYSRGWLVYEGYQNGWEQDEPHRLASGTKSISGVLAAAV